MDFLSLWLVFPFIAIPLISYAFISKFNSTSNKPGALNVPPEVLGGRSSCSAARPVTNSSLPMSWRSSLHGVLSPCRDPSALPLKKHSDSVLIPRQTEMQIVRAPGFLKAEALVHYVGIMDSQVQEHIQKHWVGKETVDVHRKAQLLLLTLSSQFFMGLEDDARVQKLCDLMNTMMLALDVIPFDFP
ncbi:hypothetical protein FEM48_Zijuj10G0116900 [Ziziphus jujuba var. spinosa]|uniref:Uncharacterized protein n=1 Tax=Ziziphus jujuba var. spinosa TaxID=714518 RepID=A0A978UN64_ZIZJJ|nr:hypothetical protein FEM48_Zijuj10G0116900 [Ziziphus jujuba var. spinosa]